MSLDTWCKEFYGEGDVGKRGAVAHALRKWRGLTKANMKKHAIVRDGGWIQDVDFVHTSASSVFRIDDSSCALCRHYLKYDDDDDDDCTMCPLLEHLGRPCFKGKGKSKSPYFLFLDTGNAMPMIRALEAISPEGA